jgi:integrase
MPETDAGTRAVPLQSMALAALEELPPRPDSPLVFPAPRGGYLDLRNFRNREWKPAQRELGIEPIRRVTI